MTPAVTTVPVPGTLPLFAAGLAALGLLGSRRKREVCVVGIVRSASRNDSPPDPVSEKVRIAPSIPDVNVQTPPKQWSPK